MSLSASQKCPRGVTHIVPLPCGPCPAGWRHLGDCGKCRFPSAVSVLLKSNVSDQGLGVCTPALHILLRCVLACKAECPLQDIPCDVWFFRLSSFSCVNVNEWLSCYTRLLLISQECHFVWCRNEKEIPFFDVTEVLGFLHRAWLYPKLLQWENDSPKELGWIAFTANRLSVFTIFKANFLAFTDHIILFFSLYIILKYVATIIDFSIFCH